MRTRTISDTFSLRPPSTPRPHTSSGRLSLSKKLSHRRSASVLHKPNRPKQDAPLSRPQPPSLYMVDFPSAEIAEARLTSPVDMEGVGLPAYTTHEEKDFVWREGTRCLGYNEVVVPYPVSCDAVMLQKYENNSYPLISRNRLTISVIPSDRHTLELLRLVAPHEITFYNFGNSPPKAVLDFGCGDGSWIRQAAARWTVRYPHIPRSRSFIVAYACVLSTAVDLCRLRPSQNPTMHLWRKRTCLFQ